MTESRPPRLKSRIDPESRKRPIIWQYAVLLLLPFLLYANTLGHQYALDDAMVITENQFVQEGFSGIPDIFGYETFVGFFGKQKELVAGGRYRPLSVASFAVERELFGESPGISHFLNIVFYALIGYLIYLILFRLLQHEERYKPYLTTLPFLAALFYIVHPLHTEAVANIKGRDEIFAMLFSMGALWFFIRNRYPSLTDSLLAAFMLLLAVFSKENAYPFVVLIPLTAWWFYHRSFREMVVPSLLFLLVAVIGLGVRYSVLGQMSVNQDITELMNNPFIAATGGEKLATTIYTWGLYLKLMVYPHPLTHDYYPYQIAIKSFSDPMVWLSVLVILAMAVEAIRGFVRRNLTGFAMLFFGATFFLVSNLIFPIGTFMAERLMFMPSLGLCLFGAWVLVKLPEWISKGQRVFSVELKSAQQVGQWFNGFARENAIGLGLLAILVVGFSYKTISRNPVWENNETLFLTDAHTSVNSAKMQNAAGGMLYDMAQATTDPVKQQEYYSRSKQHLLKAIEIHPSYQAAWKTLGNIYYFLDKDFDQAINAYTQAGETSAYDNLISIGQMASRDGDLKNAAKCFKVYIQLRPGQEAGYTELAQALVNQGLADSAIAVINRGINRGLVTASMYVKLGLAYGQGKGNMPVAIQQFQKAVNINPNLVEAYENLGVAYGMTNQPNLAIQNLQKAIELNPNNPQTHRNLAFAYSQLGNQAKAQEHEARAQALEGK